VELRCTCGALLPDDARFCHKCGKPQFEEDLARLSAEEPVVTAAPVQETAPQSAPAGISFRNSRAVAISILAAGGAFFGSGAAALISPLLWPIVPLAAGFVAALLYKLASHQPLSTANGARLGWMTGLWLFFVFMLALTAISLYIASPVGEEAVKRLQAMPQFANLSINSPHDLLMTILASSIPTFLLLTVLPGLGGMLGAKLSARR
jgi:hypothetical protein